MQSLRLLNRIWKREMLRVLQLLFLQSVQADGISLRNWLAGLARHWESTSVCLLNSDSLLPAAIAASDPGTPRDRADRLLLEGNLSEAPMLDATCQSLCPFRQPDSLGELKVFPIYRVVAPMYRAICHMDLPGSAALAQIGYPQCPREVPRPLMVARPKRPDTLGVGLGFCQRFT